jgi:hypothetical protein
MKRSTPRRSFATRRQDHLVGTTLKQKHMSLHAQPSEEVLRALDIQKRKSTVSSIVIALLSLTLLALTLAFILLPKPEEFVEFTHYPMPTITDCPPIDKPTIKTKTKPTALPAAATKYLLADTPTDLAMPAVQNATEGERIGAGDFGDGGWNGNGDGEGDSEGLLFSDWE